MTLEDVRAYIASLGLAEHVYMGKLDAKKEKSIKNAFGTIKSFFSNIWTSIKISLQTYRIGLKISFLLRGRT